MEVSDEENQLKHEAQRIAGQFFRSGDCGYSHEFIAYEALKRGKELGRKAGEEVNRAIQAREDRNFRRQLVCALWSGSPLFNGKPMSEGQCWEAANLIMSLEPKPK